MTRPVLCALDVSRPEAEAPVLRQAARLAALDEATLDVMTVVPDYGTSLVGGYFQDGHMEAMIEEAQRRLNAFADDVLGAEANAAVRHLVATGTVYEEILKAAELAGTGLIVLGAHKPDFKDYLLGPNAARVCRHAAASVFIVRD